MEQAAVTIARELIAGNGVRVARAIVHSRGIDTLGTEAPEAKSGAGVRLALVLDTSSSMDGSFDVAREFVEALLS